MTLVMSVYHFNIYPIPSNDFVSAIDFIKDYCDSYDSSRKFPFRYLDSFSSKELNFILRSLPENCTYMVRRSFSDGTTIYSLWLLPPFFSMSAIENLIKSGIIDTDRCSRDVRYYQLKDVINNLPYNYHYIVQRYYE